VKRKSLIFLAVIFFTIELFSKTSYRRGELILHLNSPITIESNGNGFFRTNHSQINEIAERYGFRKMNRIPIRNVSGTDYFYHIDFDTTQNMRGIINQLKQLPDVLSVEPNYLFELHAIDPYLPLQWALAKIQVTSAWNIESGDEAIKIAVLDGGVDYYNSNPHPDLKNNLINYSGNWGINLVNPGNQPIDVRGHGTHVLGIIGAVRLNNIGIAGMADISLINIKVTDYSSIPMEIAAIGIDTAVALGASVINMSFGYMYDDETPGVFDDFDLLCSAIQNAYSEDVVLVASAGNNGDDLTGLADSLQMYPAYFPEVISVCATDQNDVKSGYSNYANWIDIAAPGGYGHTLNSDDIYSTAPRYSVEYSSKPGWTSEYGYLWGTSMAAPHVAGLAGLILSYEPIPHSAVKEIIKQTADDISSQNSGQVWSGKIGAGRINAYSALQLLQNPPSTPTGFTGSSSGGHPRIYWNENSEADVKEYKVKRVLYNWIGPPFIWETLTSYFTTSDTFYQDNSFTIGSDNDKVYYSVCAVDYCANSSSYTSSIMYQGTSPLWKTTTNDRNTVIYSVQELDGRVCSYTFECDEYWVDISHRTLSAGDDESNDHGPQEAYKTYLSFDISSLFQSVDIISANLKVYQWRSFGDGVLGKYPVLKVDGDTTYCTVSHIVYGDSLQGIHWFAGDEGDSLTLESNIGYISTTPDVGFRELDVTQQVVNDIINNRKYSQYRLAFPIRADQDYRHDILYFYSADSDSQQYWPRLEITYQTTIIETEPVEEVPTEFCLFPNYPNPFNAATTIRYEIPEASPVIISIYDINGHLVEMLENTTRQPGKYSVTWDASSVSSGVYMYRIQAGGFQQVKKCLLVK
jgi:subtilisin family serine protease